MGDWSQYNVVEMMREGRKGRKERKKKAFGWIFIYRGRGWNRHTEQHGVMDEKSKVLEQGYYIYVKEHVGILWC